MSKSPGRRSPAKKGLSPKKGISPANSQRAVILNESPQGGYGGLYKNSSQRYLSKLAKTKSKKNESPESEKKKSSSPDNSKE